MCAHLARKYFSDFRTRMQTKKSLIRSARGTVLHSAAATESSSSSLAVMVVVLVVLHVERDMWVVGGGSHLCRFALKQAAAAVDGGSSNEKKCPNK